MADNIEVADGSVVRALDDGAQKWPAGVTAYPTTPTAPYSPQVVDLDHGYPVVFQTGYAGPFNLAQYGGSAVGAGNAVHVRPGTSAVWVVGDGGGSLTVDGTVAVSNFPASFDVSNFPAGFLAAQAGSWNVGVTGSVAVTGTFWQATQPVSLASVPAHDVTNAGTFAVQAAQAGTWNVTNVSGTVSLPTGAATGAKQDTGNTSLASIDGKLPALSGGAVPVIGPLTNTELRATAVPVSGTFYQATQPVSGTVTANAGTGPFPVSDNAGSLTVDAPVGTPVFVRLSDGTTAIATLPVSLASLPAFAAIPAVKTDQTTHGTTDLVAADITKVAGSAISQGHGTAAAAVRVELPTDGTGLVTADLVKIAGTATAVGAGVVSGGVQRTTLASDDPAVSVLGATTDAASADATGSVNAHVRAVAKQQTDGSQVAKPKTTVLTGTGITSGDVVIASTDVSDYRSGSIHSTVSATSNSAPQVQFSNDNTNWVTAYAYNLNAGTWTNLANQLTSALLLFPVGARYLRVVMSGTAANTYTATVVLSTAPFAAPSTAIIHTLTSGGSVTSSPTLAAAADGFNTGQTNNLQTVTVPHLYNGSTGDRQRNNHEVTALASAARTAAVNSSDLTNYNSRGCLIIVDVTAGAGAGGVTVTIKGKDTLSGKYTTILAATKITATGTYPLRVYPGLTAAAGADANAVIPRLWRIEISVDDTTSYTYSIGCNYIM